MLCFLNFYGKINIEIFIGWHKNWNNSASTDINDLLFVSCALLKRRDRKNKRFKTTNFVVAVHRAQYPNIWHNSFERIFAGRTGDEWEMNGNEMRKKSMKLVLLSFYFSFLFVLESPHFFIFFFSFYKHPVLFICIFFFLFRSCLAYIHISQPLYAHLFVWKRYLRNILLDIYANDSLLCSLCNILLFCCCRYRMWLTFSVCLLNAVAILRSCNDFKSVWWKCDQKPMWHCLVLHWSSVYLAVCSKKVILVLYFPANGQMLQSFRTNR